MTKIAAILISRQGLHPCQTTPWIVQIKKAFHWLQNNPYQLYTSVGQQTWEIQIFLAQQTKLDQIIVLPTNNAIQFEKLRQTVMTQFCLNKNQTQFEKIDSTGSKSWLYQRDKKIIANSDLLIPISIRKKGNMETLISAKPANNSLRSDFQIDYHPEKANIAYTIDQTQLSKKLLTISSQYLIHWTRASNDPWPTEKKYDYYQSIINSNSYPKSAFAGLENMLAHGKINASARHMPQKTPTVSFSGLPPQKALSMMSWRARYRQMSFEPYGIGIEKDYAKSMGIQAVTYYKSNQKPDNMASWLCQSIGKRSDWRLEDEYRYSGDIDLCCIPNEKKVCFCYRHNEARDIQKRFGVKSIAIVDG
jgi:hypothetical protein